MRLGLWQGQDDPIGWMDSLPSHVRARWIAYNAVEPIPFPWLQTATIASESYRVAQYIAASGGAELEPRSIGSFMPGPVTDETKPILNADQSRAWAERRVRSES